MLIFMGSSLKRRARLCAVILFLLLLAAGTASMCLGASGLSPHALLEAMLEGTDSPAMRILLYIRMPRTLAAMLAGAALAVSGVILQGVLLNPLASPNIVGVNAGAGFATLLCACFFPAMAGFCPWRRFWARWRPHCSSSSWLPHGRFAADGGALSVAVNAILSAGTDLITTLEPEATLGMSAFMVGGFSGVSAARVYTAAAYIAPALLLAAVTAGRLDVLGLGDEVAQSVGMRVRRTRVGLLILASVLAGAAISFSGLLGFAGLIVPHALRHLTGGENRTLLPLSMLGGALFVLVCDTVARTAFAPYEVPVGILLALLGGPFFLWLLLHQRKGGRR